MTSISSKEGLKIISAELKNFQSLEHKLVDIQGRSIVVVGKNGGSKSTILRAIQSPLNSVVVPAKAIKKGEEQATVTLKLAGNDAEYTYHMKFTENNQKGKIIVTDDQGNKITSKEMQGDIVGDISFDVDEFIRLGVTPGGKISKAGIQEQIEILRSFLSDEERDKLDNLEVEYDNKYDERALLNKSSKALKLSLEDVSDVSEEELDKYKEDRSEELEKVNDKLTNMVDAVLDFKTKKDSR